MRKIATHLARADLSKKVRKIFVRALIDAQTMGRPFSRDDTEIFNALTGLEADVLVKWPNPEFPKDTRHVLADGRSVSWTRAIDGENEGEKLRKTMRRLVSKDMRDFLESAEPRQCAICATLKDLTVDHWGVSFETIAREFIIEHGPIALEPKGNGVGYQFVDFDLEAEWICYHSRCAVYRVLCRTCNSREGRDGR